jgi:23S rRNA (uridine2552-2'-O)-methyltransferase
MYERKDHYWAKAKKEGYRSRAAYKLLELQKRHKIIRRGDRVLDLGCAPGGWLQVIAAEVGSRGRVVGVDLQSVKPLPWKWVELLQGNFLDPEFQKRILAVLNEKVHVVTSDMAPDTTGVGFQDHVRSCALVRQALSFSLEVLAPGGGFVAKLFQGEDSKEVMEDARRRFRKTQWIVPASTRKESSELYLLGIGFLPRSTDRNEI